MEAMKVRRKVRRKVRKGNSFSSERSSETTAISSGTHPHKFLDKPSGKAECRNIHTIGIKRDYFLFIHKVAKASMRFLPFLSHRTIVSVDKC